MQHIQPIVNSIGLMFDIAGAILVASEVVFQYRGEKHEPSSGVATQDGFGTPVVYVPKPRETNEFKNWDLRKYRNMKIGLGCLIVGFILQIVSNWVPSLTMGNTSSQAPAAIVQPRECAFRGQVLNIELFRNLENNRIRDYGDIIWNSNQKYTG